MTKRELLEEARFYQVQGMIDLLDGKSLKASTILKNESQQLAIHSWLPEGTSISLSYRATTDGETPDDFHRSCDGKGPTLVIVQSGEYICGGYTSKLWTSRM